MIRCKVVGSIAEKVASYIRNTSGGSIVIEQEDLYKSFTIDKERLENSIVNVETLIYILDSSMNFKSELSILCDLLQNSVFFKVDQIFVFGQNNELMENTTKNMKILCGDIGFDNITVTLYNNITMSEIYRVVSGITEEEEEHNVYKKVYLAEVANKAKRGYDPEYNYHNIVIKEDSSLEEYRKIQETSKLNDTKIVSDTSKQEIPKLDYSKGLQFNPLVTELGMADGDIIIVTGDSKSGTSIFASTLAYSLNNNKKEKVNLLDLSRTCGGVRSYIKINKSGTLVNNRDFLHGKDYKDNSVCLFRISDIINKDKDIEIDYLNYFLSVREKLLPLTVIDCDSNNIKDIIDLCGTRINRIVITVENSKDSIMLIKPTVSDCVSKYNTMVFLNNKVKLEDSESIMVTEIKKVLKGATLIAPVIIKPDTKLSSILQY